MARIPGCWPRCGCGADRVNDAGDVARSLTENLERIDGVSRVISPTSLEVLQGGDQGLFFDELDREAWPALRDKLLRHPFAGDFLVYSKSPELFSLLIKEHTGPTTPGVVRQRLVSEVRRVLDTDPAVAASAVSGTAVINADLNRLSWGDFLLLIPLTVVVASRGALRDAAVPVAHDHRDPDAGRVDDRGARRGHAPQRPAVYDGHDRAARPVLHARDCLQPSCHELDREPAARASRHRD